MEKSIEERVKMLELETYELKVRTSEHQGFIWKARENKHKDELFCIFAAVATAANLVMLVVQILL